MIGTPGEGTLVYRGDAVKSLGGNKVGGWLVKFGGPDQTDLSRLRDYFTPETDFGPFTKSSVLYFHGRNRALGRSVLAVGDVSIKDVGVWIEGELALRNKYERAVKELVDAGKLGWSSGTAEHLIERVEQKNGSHFISRWPLGLDASLTPCPAEPRAEAVALKSLDPGDAGDPLKSLHLGPYSEACATLAGVRSLADDLHCTLFRTLTDGEKSPPERAALCRAAVDEYRDLALRCVEGMAAVGDPDSADAVKAIVSESLARLASGQALSLHASTVATAVKDLAGRLARRKAARDRDGRPFPAGALKGLLAAQEELGAVLAGFPAGGNDAATNAGAVKQADADLLRAELRRLSLITA